MSLILAFESSAHAASAALVRGGALIGQFFLDCGLTHSETLLELARQLLDMTRTNLSDVDKIAAARGPGSFTGIRIGIAAAEGLSWGAAIPVSGVSTLEAMAYGAGIDGIICPVMDARRSEVYTALFERKNGAVTRITEDSAVSLHELSEILKKYPAPTLMGDGMDITASYMVNNGIRVLNAPALSAKQSAFGVALAAEYASGAEHITPNYLRASQAERLRSE